MTKTRAILFVSVAATLAGIALVLHALDELLGRAAAELTGGGVLVYGGFVASTIASPLPARRTRRSVD